MAVATATRCRSCGGGDLRVFLSLGDMPLPDGFRRADQLELDEPRYPLEAALCTSCSLVQILGDVPPTELFVDNYLYYSSFAEELVQRSKEYAQEMTRRRGLGPESWVVEVASNDGYLLRHFVELGVPVLGIDPAPGQAERANEIGVLTLPAFFDEELAKQLIADRGRRADLVAANNVMAHTPALNSFAAGLAQIIATDGVATIENTYVRDLIANLAFDTIYHEHFSYFSCTAVSNLMRRHGLTLNHVDSLPSVQGGSLRWTVSHSTEVDETAKAYLDAEIEEGVTSFDYYADFGRRVESLREELRTALRVLRQEGARIAAYGAAAKGTILLNAVGIDDSLIDYVVDRNVHKHGLYMPGVPVLIRPVETLVEDRPDYVLLLAWNYRDEVIAQQHEYLAGGGKLIVPVPTVEIVG